MENNNKNDYQHGNSDGRAHLSEASAGPPGAGAPPSMATGQWTGIAEAIPAGASTTPEHATSGLKLFGKWVATPTSAEGEMASSKGKASRPPLPPGELPPLPRDSGSETEDLRSKLRKKIDGIKKLRNQQQQQQHRGRSTTRERGEKSKNSNRTSPVDSAASASPPQLPAGPPPQVPDGRHSTLADFLTSLPRAAPLLKAGGEMEVDVYGGATNGANSDDHGQLNRKDAEAVRTAGNDKGGAKGKQRTVTPDSRKDKKGTENTPRRTPKRSSDQMDNDGDPFTTPKGATSGGDGSATAGSQGKRQKPIQNSSQDKQRNPLMARNRDPQLERGQSTNTGTSKMPKALPTMISARITKSEGMIDGRQEQQRRGKAGAENSERTPGGPVRPEVQESGAGWGDPEDDEMSPIRPPTRRMRAPPKSEEQMRSDPINSFSSATIRRQKLSVHHHRRQLTHFDFQHLDHGIRMAMALRADDTEECDMPAFGRAGLRGGVVTYICKTEKDTDLYESILREIPPPEGEMYGPYIILRGDSHPDYIKLNCRVPDPKVIDDLWMFQRCLAGYNPKLRKLNYIITGHIDRSLDRQGVTIRLLADRGFCKALKSMGWRATFGASSVDFWAPPPPPPNNSRGEQEGDEQMES